MATATESLNGGAENGATADLVAVKGADTEPVAVDGAVADLLGVDGADAEPVAVNGANDEPVAVNGANTEPVAVNGAAADLIAVALGSSKPRLFKKGQRATGAGDFYNAAELAAFNGGATEKDGSFKPQLFIKGQRATEAVEFYKAAFGAEEVSRAVNPKRKADQEAPQGVSIELKIGSGLILVNDHPHPEDKLRTAITFKLMTAEVTKALEKAVAAGAFADDEIDKSKSGIPVTLYDPYGYAWEFIASPVKEIADVEA